jgi:hypothetical protein
MKYRYYINDQDSHFGEFNYLFTPEGEQIAYSYMCDRPEDYPPKNRGYKLVYESETEVSIQIDPYGMRGIFED